MLWSTTMWYGSSKQPSQLHTSLYVLLIISVVIASPSFTPLVINPRFSHIESPKTGGDSELTMSNSHCFLRQFTEHSS